MGALVENLVGVNWDARKRMRVAGNGEWERKGRGKRDDKNRDGREKSQGNCEGGKSPFGA